MRKFDNFYRYQNGTINLSLISGKVYSIHMTDMDLRYLDIASDIQKFDNFYRYQNGTINLSLISGKVYSIHMADMDLGYFDMASDIRFLH
jgi:hypothetical protein